MKGSFGLAAALLVWSSSFVALYALHAVGCSAGWHDPRSYLSPLRSVLLLTWLSHLSILLLLVVRFRHPSTTHYDTPRFLQRSALALTLIALAATLWTGAPVVALELCS